MKKALFHIVIFVFINTSTVLANVYIVFYVTEKGSTGHVGIAVDNYKVVIREQWDNGVLQEREDTVATGSLTFFDLWPEKEVQNWRFSKNTAPKYFQLPRTSAEPKITPESLLYGGLPHRYRHPCDALVKITTTAKEDAELLDFVASLSVKRPYYNARKYNCVDFVCVCLHEILNKKIKAKEFVPLTMISTPNKLYLKLKKMSNHVQILRDPGSKAHGSFFVERILKNKS